MNISLSGQKVLMKTTDAMFLPTLLGNSCAKPESLYLNVDNTVRLSKSMVLVAVMIDDQC